MKKKPNKLFLKLLPKNTFECDESFIMNSYLHLFIFRYGFSLK